MILLGKKKKTYKKELYGLGVRRMGVFSAPPLGCLPSSRTLGGGKTRDCANDYNEAAQMFNTKLSTELDSLNIQFPDARLLLIDIYNPLLYLIQNPIKYGTTLIYYMNLLLFFFFFFSPIDIFLLSFLVFYMRQGHMYVFN